MYRLLIVTGEQAVWDMFAAMEGWEAIGFKQPRLRRTADEAVECMRKHHIDAIALDEGDGELDALRAHLDAQRPNMPIFQIEPTAEKQMETIREASRLLNRLYADDSNDCFDEAACMEQLRNRWMKRALSGLVLTGEEMRRALRLYRCPEIVGVPCVMARLALPEGDSFLTNRWHYGSDRLETALRNFFGARHDHMRLRVAVVSQAEVRVLCYPLEADAGISETIASDYVHETVEQIARYLGLEMKVLDLRRLPGVEALSADQIMRYAG